jgi:hypothetical protein
MPHLQMNGFSLYLADSAMLLLRGHSEIACGPDTTVTFPSTKIHSI